MRTPLPAPYGHDDRPSVPPTLTRLTADSDAPPLVGRSQATGGAELTKDLWDVLRSFQASTDPQALLAEVVTTAVRLVPGAQDASVGLIVSKRLQFQHPTSELVRDVDRLQTEVDQGPGLDARHEQRGVRVPDLALEARWPAFTRRAHGLGVRSMLSLRLRAQDRTLGVLSLISRHLGAFDPEAEEVSRVLADHAALGLATASRLDQLQRAVDSRDLIGQAKGILMERHGLDQERAFGVLTRISQSTHRKLHDVAHELVTTGRLEQLDAAARSPGQESEPG